MTQTMEQCTREAVTPEAHEPLTAQYGKLTVQLHCTCDECRGQSTRTHSVRKTELVRELATALESEERME